jgi:hypothetical protein
MSLSALEGLAADPVRDGAPAILDLMPGIGGLGKTDFAGL